MDENEKIALKMELKGNYIKELTELGMNYFAAEKIANERFDYGGEREKYSSPLYNPNLFEIITNEISKKVVGERETIKTIFLCSCGKLVKNSKKTSYNLMVNDESGVGKDWVVEKTLEIWKRCKCNYEVIKKSKDSEDGYSIDKKETDIVIKRTRISEKIFTYWHNPKFEPDWTWDGKIFYNEDISNPVLNSDVFKVMASTGSYATILIDQYPTDIEIKGKPVMIITTASANPNPENIRRFAILNLDTSINQTKSIMKLQGKYAKSGESMEYDDVLMEELKKLEDVKVRIPYADVLSATLPDNNIIMRTFFERFLDYIKASAALHQFQRGVDVDGFIIADPKDYDIARGALLKLISKKTIIPLTKNQKKIIEIMFKLGEGLHPVIDIESNVTFLSRDKLRENLDKLADKELLVKGKVENEEKRKELIAYSYNESTDIKIPIFDEIPELLTLLTPINPPLTFSNTDNSNPHSSKTALNGVSSAPINPINPHFCDRVKTTNNMQKKVSIEKYVKEGIRVNRVNEKEDGQQTLEIKDE